jgi:hypothetical protein
VSSERHDSSFAAVENSEPLVGDPGEWHLSIVEHFDPQCARSKMSLSLIYDAR